MMNEQINKFVLLKTKLVNLQAAYNKSEDF